MDRRPFCWAVRRTKLHLDKCGDLKQPDTSRILELTLRTLREKYQAHSGCKTFTKEEKNEMKQVVLTELQQFVGRSNKVDKPEDDVGLHPCAATGAGNEKTKAKKGQSIEPQFVREKKVSNEVSSSPGVNNSKTKCKKLNAEQVADVINFSSGEDGSADEPASMSGTKKRPVESPAVKKAKSPSRAWASPRRGKAMKRLSSEQVIAELANDSFVSLDAEDDESSDSRDVSSDQGSRNMSRHSDVGPGKQVNELSDGDDSDECSFVEWQPRKGKKTVVVDSDDEEFDSVDSMMLSPIKGMPKDKSHGKIRSPVPKNSSPVTRFLVRPSLSSEKELGECQVVLERLSKKGAQNPKVSGAKRSIMKGTGRKHASADSDSSDSDYCVERNQARRRTSSTKRKKLVDSFTGSENNNNSDVGSPGKVTNRPNRNQKLENAGSFSSSDEEQLAVVKKRKLKGSPGFEISLSSPCKGISALSQSKTVRMGVDNLSKRTGGSSVMKDSDISDDSSNELPDMQCCDPDQSGADYEKLNLSRKRGAGTAKFRELSESSESDDEPLSVLKKRKSTSPKKSADCEKLNLSRKRGASTAKFRELSESSENDDESLSVLKKSKSRCPKKSPFERKSLSLSGKGKKRGVSSSGSSSESDDENLTSIKKRSHSAEKQKSTEKKVDVSSGMDTSSLDFSDSENIPVKNMSSAKSKPKSFDRANEGSSSGPSKKRKRSQGSSQERGPAKKVSKMEKDLGHEKHYKNLVKIGRAAGLFINFRAMSKMEMKKKVKFMKDMLETAGMEGWPTLEKAEELKLRRELAELNAENVIIPDGGRSRNTRTSRSQVSTSRPSCKPQTPAKKKFSRIADIIDSEGSSD